MHGCCCRYLSTARLFSVGDAHFAQGDGEACGTAIEMCGSILVRFSLHKGEAQRRGIRFPRFPRDDYYFPPGARRPQALYGDDRDVGPRRRHQRERGRDSEREERAVVDDRPFGRARLEPPAGLCDLHVAVDLKISELVDVPNMSSAPFCRSTSSASKTPLGDASDSSSSHASRNPADSIRGIAPA